jgi:hypothetical protein
MPNYKVIDITPSNAPAGDDVVCAQAASINNSTDFLVVGAVWTQLAGSPLSTPRSVYAFTYKRGASSQLLLGVKGAADGVNDQENAVVGRIGEAAQSGKAYLYDPGSGSFLDLQAQLGAPFGEARGVKNSLIVGRLWNGSMFSSFLYDFRRGNLFQIPMPSGIQRSAATAINGNGQVTGIMWLTADPYAGHQAYLYDHRNRTTVALPGVVSPYAINDAGIIVGAGPKGPVVCDPANNYNPVTIGPNAILTSTTITSDGMGVAYGINNSGVVVGTIGKGGFIWSPPDAPQNIQLLDSLRAAGYSNWKGICPVNINDNGYIVGSAGDSTNQFPRAVLLDPNP